MKKLILILSLMAFLSSSAWAQVDIIPDLRQEISIGYGNQPVTGYQWRWNSSWYYYQTTDNVGAFIGTYTYRINGEKATSASN